MTDVEAPFEETRRSRAVILSAWSSSAWSAVLDGSSPPAGDPGYSMTRRVEGTSMAWMRRTRNNGARLTVRMPMPAAQASVDGAM